MYNHSDFTKEERDACLPIIDELLACLKIARREGVLALEDYAWKQPNYFLRFGLSLVVDGTDPKLVEGILENLIASKNHKGSALLERILITGGVLSIQAGEIPRIAEIKLLSYLGESYLAARGFPKDPNSPERIAEMSAALLEKAPFPESAALAKVLTSLSNRDMQLVLRHTDQKTIGIAIKGCGDIAASHVGSNLSPRLEALIAEDMHRMGAIKLGDILAEQAAIAKTIKALAEKGEIVVEDELLQALEYSCVCPVSTVS